VALTVLGDSWYNQVSLLGRAVDFRWHTWGDPAGEAE